MFLSFGLQHNVSALRGRLVPVPATAAVKLVAVPLVCLVVVRALGIGEPVASAAVLHPKSG